jgi:Secretion system C-terminal sorting domain
MKSRLNKHNNRWIWKEQILYLRHKKIKNLKNMKNFPKTIICISLSVLTIGAFGQIGSTSQESVLSLHKMQGNPSFMLNNKIRTHAPINYDFLFYQYPDSLESPTGSYDNWFGQYMNSRYDINDTGADVNGGPSNQFLLHSAIVAFDTLFNDETFTGTASASVSSLTVDSIFVLLGHENLSGTRDSVVIQINSVDPTGYPTSTVLWADTIFTDTGLSYGNTWMNIYTFQAAPNLTLPSGSKFAISMQYFGSKLDTLGFLYGFPEYICTPTGGSAGIYADTTLFGIYPISTTYPIRANSFVSGWQYFGLGVLTLPNSSYGEGIYYACTGGQSGVLYWQDIGMAAEVSYTPVSTDVNKVQSTGLSVGQNYPNPFNQQTQITYSLSKSADVTFSVYDMIGRVLVNNVYTNCSQGQHTINLNANSFSPGVYFYTFNVNGNKVTKKMVITE